MKTSNIFPFIFNLDPKDGTPISDLSDSFKMSAIAPSVYLLHFHRKPDTDKTVEIRMEDGYTFGVNLGDDFEFQIISGDAGVYRKYTSVIYHGKSRKADIYF